MFARTPNPRWRLSRAIALLVYIGVLGMVPVADALAEAEASRGETHIEAESSEYHFVGHDELFCQLCRLIEMTAQPALAHAGRPRASGHHRDSAPHPPLLRRLDTVASRGPRAPPAR